MKKILILLFLITSLSFSRGIKGLGKLVGIALEISKKQGLMQIEQVQQGFQMLQQIQNQVQQIENQYTLLKGLSKEISEGNFLNVDAFYNELGYMYDSYKSVMLDSSELAKKYTELYETNPEKLEQMGFGEEYIKEMNRNMREARRQSDMALYDVMVSKGFSAKIGADKQNIKTLLNASKSATGVVEALQVTNALLGQISKNITQLGIMTEGSIKANAMATTTASKDIEASQRELEDIKQDQQKNDDRIIREMKQKLNKKIRI